MAYADEQVRGLRPYCAAVSEYEESGLCYLLLEGLVLPEGCSPGTVDALLLPRERDAYPSRLYLSEQVSTRRGGQNWNGSLRILERNWYAFSWKVSGSGLKLDELLARHLRGLL